jgi:hypothetical protein
MEHASIAAFARFTLHLLHVGAPARLVELSNAAMADETVHARLAFGIASRYAGHDIGPGALDIDGALETCAWTDVLRTTIREGCIGETIAAIEAAEALEHARDTVVRAALERITADETRHAELAWHFARWAIDRFGDEARTIARAEFGSARNARTAPTSSSRNESLLLAAGILPDRLKDAVRSEALTNVIGVCADALLGAPEGVCAA